MKLDKPILIDSSGILVKYGFDKVPIVINYSTLKKTFLKHGIPKEDLILLKEQIENNLLIASSLTRSDSIILFIGQWDFKNRPIMVALNLEKMVNETPIYKITSIYGRDNCEKFIRRLYETDKIIYYNENAYLWFKILGFEVPNNVIADEAFYIGKYFVSLCITKKLTPPIEL